MSVDYFHEKFSAAVQSMAASPESIQDRIADAYISQLHVLQPDELPDEIRMDFKIMVQQLTGAEPLGNEGSVKASVNQMSEDDAVSVAQKIVHMYDAIEARYHEELASGDE